MKLLVLLLCFSTSLFSQIKNAKSIEHQVKEYVEKFEKLDISQQRQESVKLVNFLNSTDKVTKGLWLEELMKYKDKINEKKNEENNDRADTIQNINSDFSPTTFSSIPDEYAGCSYVFSENSQKFEKDEFLYFDDMGTVGIISINGKTHILDQTSTFKEGEDEITIYSNDLYSAYVHLIRYLEESSEESHFYSGELIIKDKTGKEIKIKVYGEGGC